MLKPSILMPATFPFCICLQMKVAFNTFEKFASQIGGQESLPYADQLLIPLYKVSEGYSGKAIPGKFSSNLCKKLSVGKGTADLSFEFAFSVETICYLFSIFFNLHQNLRSSWPKRSQKL